MSIGNHFEKMSAHARLRGKWSYALKWNYPCVVVATGKQVEPRKATVDFMVRAID